MNARPELQRRLAGLVEAIRAARGWAAERVGATVPETPRGLVRRYRKHVLELGLEATVRVARAEAAATVESLCNAGLVLQAKLAAVEGRNDDEALRVTKLVAVLAHEAADIAQALNQACMESATEPPNHESN